MFGRNIKSVVTGAIVAALLTATPLASSVASAQDAIMLEKIGAVRMARPDEMKRTDEREAAAPTRQQSQEHPAGRS